MIRGLQITIPGEALSLRIGERIQVHQSAVSVLDGKIKRRDGDLPFDVRVEDGLESLGELESERARRRGVMARLTLLRDHVDPAAMYRLREADLAFGELLPEMPRWLEQQEWEERTSVGPLCGPERELCTRCGPA